MIKTSRKPITNSYAVLTRFRQALIVLAGAATIMGLAAVPAAATRSAAAGAVPPNQAPRSAVAVAFDSTGSGFAFYRGQDHAIYMRSLFGARAWSAQTRVGGYIRGAPSAAVARTTLVVAGRGTDNTLRLRMMHNGVWSHWSNWGGTLSASPAITGTSSGRIDAFIRGADHALWVRTLRPGQRLTKWTRLGGQLSTAPAAVAVDPIPSKSLPAGLTTSSGGRPASATGHGRGSAAIAPTVHPPSAISRKATAPGC